MKEFNKVIKLGFPRLWYGRQGKEKMDRLTKKNIATLEQH